MGEDFKIGPIRIATHHTALIGIMKALSINCGDANTLVTNRPIYLAVRAQRGAVHVMSRIGNMQSKTGRQDLSLINFAVVIRVGEFPQIRSDR